MKTMEKETLSAAQGKRVALVHDFLMSYGGAERVFGELARMFPEAPLYTLLADPQLIEKRFPGRDIRTSFLSRLPGFLKRRYRFFLPFFPIAVESFDLRDFDLVISSSGAWSKGLITRLNTQHLAYIHSPMRYAWDYHEEYLLELGAQKRRTRLFTRILASYLRLWDRQAALRPDFLIANSHFTAARIKKYYQRDCAVVYPGALPGSEEAPEETPGKKKTPDGDAVPGYFLTVARLTASKKIGPVIEAFHKLKLPLVVVGEGRERKKLEKLAGKNVRFTGFVSDRELGDLYEGARALVFPSEEDFGMAAVEALSLGTPVIALEYGGIREIVQEGITGEFFHRPTPELIAEGIRRFLLKEKTYDRAILKQSVSHFSRENFRLGIERSLAALAEKK